MFNKKETPISKSRGVLKQMSQVIVETFNDFGVPVKLVDSVDGLRNYHFYIQPLKTTRMKALVAFKDDLRYALENNNVEIEAPIPDKKLVGITVPKKGPFPSIAWNEAVTNSEFLESDSLVVPLGVDEFGAEHLLDIVRTPHLLIAGSTGSGKSCILHSFINSLLLKHSPETLRFVFCDPKRIELSMYTGIPHLLTSPIHDGKKCSRALLWVVKEMQRRYDILDADKAQNITTYQQNIYQPAKAAWKKAGSKASEKTYLPEALPFIVVIIDEINDFMQTYPSELEGSVTRLAQMGRAVGIHLIIATQRPSVNVITGTIKANIPSRIAFKVASQVDSRTIVDQPGAEKLNGQGDLLYQAADDSHLIRIQSYFVEEAEILKRVAALVQADTVTALEHLDLDETSNDNDLFVCTESGEEYDSLYDDAKLAVMNAGRASTSYLQRSLRVGYSRAARLMDLLEEGGVIGPQDGSRPRTVIEDK
jgi:S-DNA-T family DNA segregation ATPase FtsK/SpoIIIE